MRQLYLGAVLISAALAQVALADELPPWLTERRIIGHNDLEPIEATLNTDIYDKARIVARMEDSAGDGFCTSSRVAPDLFLTNFHCYDYKPCAEVQFHIGYEKGVPSGDQLIYKCKEVLGHDLPLDYALYRVELVGPLPSGDEHTQSFTDLALAIPDNDPTGVYHDFDIKQDGTILDFKLHVHITHTYPGDLTLQLTSPKGTVVKFENRDAGSGSALDKTFDFASGLRALAGEDATGTWRLTVRDLAAADTGTLDSVDFIITTPKADGSTDEPSQIEYPTATLWAGPIAVDQPLLVASHPSARLKEIDRSETCKIRTIEPEIVEQRQTITHTCDTEGGSSGSPVLDRATGRIVALHWGGQDDFNMAIPMALIVKDFESKLAPEVLAELSIAR